MSAVTDIYDPLSPAEAALAALFKANEITCYTPLGEQMEAEEAAAQDPTVQFIKKRPRVEVLVTLGASHGWLFPHRGVRAASGFMREKARQASLLVKIVTDANIALHRQFQAQVLFVLDTAGEAIRNTTAMPNHTINRIKVGGTSLNYLPENGIFETSVSCDLDISVNDTAWPALVPLPELPPGIPGYPEGELAFPSDDVL